jgi:hypothetical protein
MTAPTHPFFEGDRVRAVSRPGFPRGTVVKVMNLGYLLVVWDGEMLETAHHSDLEKVMSSPVRSISRQVRQDRKG